MSDVSADPAPLLRVEEVAARLRVSSRRVRQIPPAELPYAQLGTRGQRKYDARDLARYMERRMVR